MMAASSRILTRRSSNCSSTNSQRLLPSSAGSSKFQKSHYRYIGNSQYYIIDCNQLFEARFWQFSRFVYENQEFSTNNQSINKINALNIIGFARFLFGISVFYFNSVLYFICDTIATLVGSCFVPRESTIKRNVANLFKL